MTDTSRPLYRLLHELDDHFDQLINTIHHAATLYEAKTPATWRFDGLSNAGWLRAALLDMWHQQNQDGRETRNYIALIAADDTLISAFQEVNAAKKAISELLQRIKQSHPNALSEAKHRLPQRHPEVETVLRQGGLARLHLKQCWRQLPIAEAPVARVRFAWYSSGRSIKRITVQEAEQKLLQLDTDSPHIRIQLRRLAGIPSSEPLAQVQNQAPLMRGNLFFTEPLEDGHTRRALNIAMPLIVPAPENRLPHIKMPPLEPPAQRTRAKRRDEKLESDVFLPSLRVYRYR
ncbi:DNA replication terminus site-binding protein [Halomonas sp. 707B3]|uniref:DNA replication terminus site-binding protein n=1 Tax=Halomonas sp. 707B3 TaxID=1681043 RepID=UPI00209DA26D|nr:DNA replication terminus site-binding protein [Halomonas sp. 707B3]MCP1317409.1 DNA replication terminus site-binding protein [Halomonas sp. 707B3]